MWQTGDIIDDKYKVRQVFTSGGMGVVYRIYHQSWDMELALKVPRITPLIVEKQLNAFRRECELWSGLSPHPHVVSCHYVRKIEATLCVLTEYVDGGSLLDWIHTRQLYRGTEENALARILDIAIQSAWGLEHAHTAGLVHQDVKPGNILVMADGTAKVTDFGLACIASDKLAADGHDLSLDGLVSVNGMTPAFCSPEQARKERVSFKTDIYSWAVSVLEMFTGDVTWASGVAACYALEDSFGKPVAPYIPDMPKPVFELLLSCMAKEPEVRPSGFYEIADHLQKLFFNIFGEPHDRVRPDMALSQLDALNNRALSMLDLGHPRKDVEGLLIEILKRDPLHPQALANLDLLKSGQGGNDASHFMLAKPKSGFDYYEEQRKFDRLCAKIKRAIAVGKTEEARRYLQQAKDLENFKRHPRLMEFVKLMDG